MTSNKPYKILTWGCQMNEYDSQCAAGILESMGYVEARSDETPAIVVFNTCTIREKAEQKFYSALGRYRKMKKNNPDSLFFVCGCVAQKEGENIFKRFPFVNAVLGTDAIYDIKTHLESCLRECNHLCDIAFLSRKMYNGTGLKRTHKVKAWVKIMEGCNNFCSFCIVPYVRGRERSRPVADIVNEVAQLVSEGYKEVTLIGQNVNSYKGNKKESFPNLLETIVEKTDIKRLRFITSHPKDLSPELINSIAQLKPVCKHIHLPIQSGSDKILRLMNRKYTCQEYMNKIERLKDAIPDLGISTDIIVGFPYEETSDFEQTTMLLEKVRYNSIFAFQYSPRKRTKAASYTHEVPFAEGRERLKKVLALQTQINAQINKARENTRAEILIEDMIKRNSHFTLTGRTSDNTVVLVTSPSTISPGSIREVYITDSSPHGLKGIVTENHP